MTSLPQRTVNTIVADPGVHRAVKRVHMLGTILVAALALAVLGAVVGMLVRTYRPVAGTRQPVVLAGLVALAALGGGVVLTGYANRRARSSSQLAQAVTAYLGGCLGAGAVNLLAWLVTLGVLLANGISHTLWLPTLIVLGLNFVGVLLALPRLKHLRRLYYSPSLPFQKAD
jgi:hypothetical protein